MPDIEETLKAEIRLYALETLICQLYVWFYEMTGKPHWALETRRKILVEAAQKKTFPRLGAAMSDFVSAELEAAVDRLLTMQRELLGDEHPDDPPKVA
jgi:hypothetical protein